MERIFWMGVINRGNVAARVTGFFTVPPDSFIVITAEFFTLTQESVYQFTCTEQ
jgi:hypothetical protein